MTGAIYVAGPLDYETRKRVCINITNSFTLKTFFSIFGLKFTFKIFLYILYTNDLHNKEQKLFQKYKEVLVLIYLFS